jgi:hypothetical protein
MSHINTRGDHTHKTMLKLCSKSSALVDVTKIVRLEA